MDKATLGGWAIAFVALVGSVLLDHGSLAALFNPSAALLVLGGTLGATMVSFSLKDIKAITAAARVALRDPASQMQGLIDMMVGFAESARREGLLALDRRLEDISDPFLKAGIQSVVDGVDPELVRALLETELTNLERRHEVGAKVLETAGGYAPTMGIIGTVMGLVHVLSNLTSAASLGPSIATAFIATLYGIGTANLAWLPLSTKLKNRSAEEVQEREMMIEGVLSIQAGDNPRIIREKLEAFLPPSLRQREDAPEPAAVR